MGRVKLQIKRIENTTNRQVTFSKRRNGLIKKAYELSILCDVDVALLMFSPSGRLSLFSGNKSIEEILARYSSLPEHERGRMHNREFLQQVVSKLRSEADPNYQITSPVSTDSQLEEIQHEILCFKAQVEEMKNRLRIFEGDQSEVANFNEAVYREQILQETLKNVFMRKQILAEKYNPYGAQFTAQIQLPPENTRNTDELVVATTQNSIDGLPPRDPHIQILTFLDINGLLPLRDEVQRGMEILDSSPTLLGVQSVNVINVVDDEHINPTIGFENDNGSNNIVNTSNSAQVQRISTPHHQLGEQLLDINTSPWTQLYSTEQERQGGELHGLYMCDQYAAPDASIRADP